MNPSEQVQELCELGQRELMRMEYLRAEKALVQAETTAVALKDFDTLSRLYMPLQECRRQRRQRCGEGVIRLDLIATGPDDRMDGRRIVEDYPHGQLLVGGWGTIEPALKVRELQIEHELYVETFLAAVYPIGEGARAVVIVPLPDVRLPDASPRGSIDELLRLLPAHCIVLNEKQLPQGSQRGDARTFERVMSMWEQLHLPFLAAADATADPVERIEGYRRTIRVDYACELAHQKLSDAARQLTRPGFSPQARGPQ
jgi:hypothetical protein